MQEALPIPQGLAEFLASPIGEEKNGMELSLLSALVRLNLDPWEEAIRLTQMTRGAAVQSLTRTIAKVPVGKWQSTDAGPIASRLMERLPPSPQAKPYPGEVRLGRFSNENTWGRLVMPLWGAAIFFALFLWWWHQ
ncbi:MAG: hypothetical protein AB7S41_17160 [Parvibaculaceae bacterium]